MHNQHGSLPAPARQPGFYLPAILRKIANYFNLQSTWTITAFAFCWFAATTGLYPLLLPDEGRYVGEAWGMICSGYYAVPLLDGLPFFNLPPLSYCLSPSSLLFFAA